MLYEWSSTKSGQTAQQTLEVAIKSEKQWIKDLATYLITLENIVLIEETNTFLVPKNLVIKRLYEEKPELFAVPGEWIEKVAKQSDLSGSEILDLKARIPSAGYLSTQQAAQWLASINEKRKKLVARKTTSQEEAIKMLDQRIQKEVTFLGNNEAIRRLDEQIQKETALLESLPKKTAEEGSK